MKRFTLAMVLVLALAFNAFAANFSDVPYSHWAYDAVKKLSAKGILTGFPDGTFKGNKKVSRYELAVILSRLLKQIQNGNAPAMSADDKKTVEKLTVELADELSLLGVKVTALEDEVAVLKDDVANLKENGVASNGSVLGNIKMSGEFVLDYNEFDYDDNPATAIDDEVKNRGFRNFWYLNMDVNLKDGMRAYVQFFNNDMDWNTTAGNDPVRADVIKQAYLQMKDFDLFGLTKFDKATFGRQKFTLGNGLLINARMDGAVMEGKDYRFFLFEEGSTFPTRTDDAFNMWGLDYKFQKDFAVYVTQYNGNANKIMNYGLAYNSKINDKVNVCAEYTQYTYDQDVVKTDGTNDDSFAAMMVAVNTKLNEKDNLLVKYINQEEGRTPGIYDGSINNDDKDILSIPLFTNFGFNGNVDDIYVKYSTSLNKAKLALIYESFEPSDTATGAADGGIDIITLGYQKEVRPNCDMTIAYSMISPDDNLWAASAGNDVDDIYYGVGAAPTAADRDETMIKMQLRIKF